MEKFPQVRQSGAMRAAVIGHIEWIDFLRVPRIPAPGEIVHATEAWEEVGGGGAVAAVQLARLAGGCTFFTALGNDERAGRSRSDLAALGVRLEASRREEPQRRGITHIDASGERTITVLGDRLGPNSADPLPWHDLATTDAVYVTAGDTGAIRAARKAAVVVATSRVVAQLAEAGIELDALVGSARDPAETYVPGDLDPAPKLVVRTAGADGGTYFVRDSGSVSYAAAPLPGPIVDLYGAGDSFAAGLTFALGRGDSPGEAVAFAARCGAAVAMGRGPYEAQLRI